MIGKKILHYNIIENLGEGGFGVIYLAEDLKLERNVAIKFLPKNIAHDLEERKRLNIEAKAAAALNHPNIATIFSIEEAGDDVFIVMEYIDGLELKDKIKSASMPIREAVEIAIQIAEGIKAAHKKGIIHRDIKSQNIMITNDGRVKVMDFGLAKLSCDVKITKPETTMGTPAYMSPEQILAKKVDHRTDIWSFGVVFYEMITGVLPFNGEYDQAITYSIINEEPPSLLSFKDFPDELIRITDKLLKKKAATRYQQMDDVLLDLKTLLEKLTQPPNENHEITSEARSSIAVLPFINMSSDPDQEYFCDGISEEIINSLVQINNLRVIARTSVFAFKRKILMYVKLVKL